MSTTLTVSEQQDLKEREARLEKNLNAAYEDLAAIRDKQLYIGTHATFEAYCRERWNISKSRAYQLLEAADIKKNVHNCGQELPKLTRESHARELGKAPREKQAEAWAEANKDGKPTAVKVEAAVKKVSGGVTFNVEELEEADDELDLKELSAPYKSAGQAIDKVRRDMKALADDELLGGHLRDKITRVETSCRELKATISQMEPTEVCGKCHGKRCKWCASTGFWTKAIVQSRA